MSFDDSVRLIWSLTSNGPATSVTTSGDSGPYSATSVSAYTPRSAVDLRRVDDVWLSVFATTVAGTTPSLAVSLGAYDDLGNLFGGLLPVTALTAAGGKVAFGGRHGGGGSGSYFVLPDWGQIAWVVTGTTPAFTGLEIALYGR